MHEHESEHARVHTRPRTCAQHTALRGAERCTVRSVVLRMTRARIHTGLLKKAMRHRVLHFRIYIWTYIYIFFSLAICLKWLWFTRRTSDTSLATLVRMSLAAFATRNLTTAAAAVTTVTLPVTHHGVRTACCSVSLSCRGRAAPYGASAIIGELRCLFGGASADQSRLAARSSPVLAFVSLLAAVSYSPVSFRVPHPAPQWDFKGAFTLAM